MKILGIGVDVIENRRIKNLINNKSFIKRTFGKKEVIFSKKTLNKTNYFAKRFAAKEAFAKSIGTGFRNNFNLVCIENLTDQLNIIYDEFKIIKKSSLKLEENIIKNLNSHLSTVKDFEFSIKKRISSLINDKLKLIKNKTIIKIF